MNGFEKFGLISGIIGLIADVIGLIAFFAGFWIPSFQTLHSGEMPLIWQIVTGITILYGWIAISWFITRRSFNQRKLTRGKSNKVSVIAAKAVTSIGIIVLPIALAWIIAINQGPIAAENFEIEQYKTLQVTETARAYNTPEALRTPVAKDMPYNKAESDLYFSIFCPGPFGYLIIGFGVWTFITLLMPLVYTNVPEEDIIKAIEHFMNN